MKKETKGNEKDLVFTPDNPGNIFKAMASHKNIVVCGIKGVGKITNTIAAVKGYTHIYYIGNPVDFEGKRRPGSYEKYLAYIQSLKKDIRIIDEIPELFVVKHKAVLVIDEIFGRSDAEIEGIGKVLDMPNIHVFQIVGCLKYMGPLIDKMNLIIQLHNDGAFVIEKEFAKIICKVLGSGAEQKLFG